MNEKFTRFVIIYLQVERLWEDCYSSDPTVRKQLNINDISDLLVTDQINENEAVDKFLAYRLMSLYGSLFFQIQTDSHHQDVSGGPVYIPLIPLIVQEKLRERAVLKDFKKRYKMNINNSPDVGKGKYRFGRSFLPTATLPPNIASIIQSYEEVTTLCVNKTLECPCMG